MDVYISLLGREAMSRVEADCGRCGVTERIDSTYFRVFGDDFYCEDCLIHTRCQRCQGGLRLRPSRYQNLGGDPVVCSDCGSSATSSQSTPTGSGAAPPETTQSTPSGSSSFWDGLTRGEKVVFPILLLLFLGYGSIAVLGAQNGADIDGTPLAGLLILLVWTYRRGKKNG
jgi:hypothetical protein